MYIKGMIFSILILSGLTSVVLWTQKRLNLLHHHQFELLVLLAVLCGMSVFQLALMTREWMKEHRARMAPQTAEARLLAESLLTGTLEESIGAAVYFAENRDVSAVPVLLYALDSCVMNQQPGWRERGEAYATALGRIGDRRALSPLQLLENVRGIGFISSIRMAIALIEPQTSLLRPMYIHSNTDSLLRPIRSKLDQKHSTLLRQSEYEQTQELREAYSVRQSS